MFREREFYIYEIRGTESCLQWLEGELVSANWICMGSELGPEETVHPQRRHFTTDLARLDVSEASAAQIGTELVWLFNGAISILAPRSRFRQSTTVLPQDLFVEAPTQLFELFEKRPPFDSLRLISPSSATTLRDVEPEYLAFQTAMKLVPRPTPVLGCFGVTELLECCLAGISGKLSSEQVYVLVKLCGMELNWLTIRQIRETLQSIPGTRLDVVQENQIGNTANNFSITKFNSLHGLKLTRNGNPEKNVSLSTASRWTLEEVRKVIALAISSRSDT